MEAEHAHAAGIRPIDAAMIRLALVTAISTVRLDPSGSADRHLKEGCLLLEFWGTRCTDLLELGGRARVRGIACNHARWPGFIVPLQMIRP